VPVLVPVAAVLFDKDGTLLDASSGCAEAVALALAEIPDAAQRRCAAAVLGFDQRSKTLLSDAPFFSVDAATNKASMSAQCPCMDVEALEAAIEKHSVVCATAAKGALPLLTALTDVRVPIGTKNV
jgi:phosphoglycolate phosphatase-like HAD superfamily hydrolase